jgi:hypothetical protein
MSDGEDDLYELTPDQRESLTQEQEIEYLIGAPFGKIELDEYYRGLFQDEGRKMLTMEESIYYLINGPLDDDDDIRDEFMSKVIMDQLEPIQEEASEDDAAAEPEAEGPPIVVLPETSNINKLRNRLVKRTQTVEADVFFQEKVRHSSLITGLKKGVLRKSSVIFKDLGIPIPDTIKFVKGSDSYELRIGLESKITLNQKLKDSGLVVIDIKFSGSNKVFNVHLSYWPKINLPDTHPSNYSLTDFKIFKNGSIHLVLDYIKGAVDNTTYLKLTLDPGTKQFMIPGEDLGALTIEPNNGEMAQKFFQIILVILNHTKDYFFPELGKSKRKKSRKKRKKSKKKKRKKSKKKKSKKKRSKRK